MAQIPSFSPWSRLDDQSRRIVIGFLTRLAFGIPLLVLSTTPAAAIHTYAALSVVTSGVLAILLRHPFNGPRFTLWDDALWFSAIGHVAQMLGRA